MARQLKMAEVTTIRTLHASGHSNREIARLLGVHRDTVGRYVAAGDAEPAKPDHAIQSAMRWRAARWFRFQASSLMPRTYRQHAASQGQTGPAAALGKVTPSSNRPTALNTRSLCGRIRRFR
jgi:hypothetical protein